ncbi:ribose 5-phosphate isomerase B [bacterium]|nr:ribose 5-phosphate isomerase B [bacterium]
MKISIGSDHRGIDLRKKIKDYLDAKGYEVLDFGSYSEESTDYPDIGYQVALSVREGRADRGILLCYTGVGMSIIANKVKGVYGALAYSEAVAQLAREHNNANILVLPAGFTTFEQARERIDIFLNTPFSGDVSEGERHKRRVDKIKKYENL